MDLELRGNCRWKCKRCGEYNQPEFQDSIAEQILDPLESVYVKLIDLMQETETAGGQLNPGYARLKISEIAKEMNIALTLVRHDVEGLLEVQYPPHEFYDGGGRPRKDLDIYDDWRNQASATNDLDK